MSAAHDFLHCRLVPVSGQLLGRRHHSSEKNRINVHSLDEVYKPVFLNPHYVQAVEDDAVDHDEQVYLQ